MSEIVSEKNLILIIDDNIEMIRFLSTIVKQEAQVVFATTAAAGMRMARQSRPTLILLDLNLPDLNGYDVCKLLQEDEDTKESPIIIVTAETSMDAEIAALNAGAVDFISKPLNPAVVLARVKTHIRLRQNTKTLEALVHRDGLTGIFNRRYFDMQMSLEFQRHQRQKLPLGIAMIDIDYFKKYNDQYGHLEGDNCLIRVANAIESASRRPGETVARYGGEEFIAILPYTTIPDIKKYGEFLCENIRNLQIPHHVDERFSIVTVSIGAFSAIPNTEINEHEFIAQADTALYRAKSDGRDCVRVSGLDLFI